MFRHATSPQKISQLSGWFRRKERRVRRHTTSFAESLEPRTLLTVSSATLADAAFWGASAAGISGNASAFSVDSQLIAFESDAGNLAPNDFNGLQDIFVRDMASGVTTLVSVTPDGVSGSGPSFNPQLSADGRYVLFESEAKDLVANDTNGAIRDVFVRDLLNQTTTLVSVSVTGGSGNNHSSADFISQDGQLAGFHSSGTNFVNGGGLNQQNIYVRNLSTQTTVLVTANFDGGDGQRDSFGVNKARLSPDNRFVAFDSEAPGLIVNDTNGILRDVFIRDLHLNTTTLVSANSAGTGTGNNRSFAPTFDPTGRYVAFVSEARDLVPGNPLSHQIYLRDTLLNITTHISIDNTFDGEIARQSNTPIFRFSPDGRYLTYEALVTDTNRQIYARDLVNNTTLLVSENRFSDAEASHLSDGISSRPSFSPDGETIYFVSTASNLIDENTNGVSQIYARHLPTRTISLLSRGIDSLPGNAASAFPVISSDGESLAFESQATNLVVDDNNRLKDLFVLNVATSEISLHSPRDPLQPLSYTSRTKPIDQPQPTGISTDGRYIVFNSEAQDLVTNTVSGRNAYRHDRQTGTTELVSINPDGSGGNNSSGVSGATAVSADGRFVIFGSLALNPVPGLEYQPGLPGGPRGIFVRDMQLGTTRVINRNAAGYVAGLSGERFTISPDGRYAVFATNQPLLADDTNDRNDVYVFDLELDELSLVSENLLGIGGNNDSTILQTNAVGEVHNIFSADGRYLVFTSDATDLTPVGGTNGALYVRDLVTGTTVLASLKSDGTAAQTFTHALSGDGSRLVFVTNAKLVAEDTDNSFDVYIRDLIAETTTLISTELNSGASNPTLSRDGQKVLYSLSGPTGTSLIRRDLGSQTTQVVHTGSDMEYRYAVNEDGRYVAFLDTTVASNGLTYTSDLLFYDAQEQTTTVASLNDAGTEPASRGVVSARPLIDAAGSMVAFSSDSFDLIESDTNGRSDVFYFLRPLGGGSLRGEVFSDADADGDRDALEVGLDGWRVFLDSNGDGIRQVNETQVVAAANGQYAFTGLVPGTYRVVAEQRDAFVQSAPPSLTYDASIVADETVAGLDFGFQQQFADLRVDAIYLPVVSGPGETAAIHWDVSNQGVFDANGNWQDAVYLSKDAHLSPDDVLLGTTLHVGGLAIDDFYSGSLVATLPAVLPGDYYILIQTDRRGQVPQDNRTNDLLASSTTIHLDVPELLVDVDLAGTLWGPGLRQYFKINPPADRSLEITLDSLALSGASAVYVSREAMPTPGDFDFRGQSFEPDARLVIPRTVGQSTYYIMVEGQFGDAATAGFTLSGRLPGLSMAGISPNQGGNTGRVTVRIDGTELTPTTTVQLFNDTTTIDTAAIDYRDATHMFATFDLTGVVTGSYHMFVFDGPANDLVTDVFQVVPGLATPLVINLIAPGAYLRTRTATLLVEVRNAGNIDVIAPMLQLSSDAAYLSLAEHGNPVIPADAPQIGPPIRRSQPFLAVSQDGPAGILRPGETSRTFYRFNVPTWTSADRIAPFFVEQAANPDDLIDWQNQKDDRQPSFVSDEAWSVIWDRFTDMGGHTIADYHSLLAGNASYLSELGVRTADLNRLTNLTLQQANNAVLGSVFTTDVDLSTTVPGLSLDLSRVNFRSLSGRYRLGPLGRGWAHNWEIAAVIDAPGNISIEEGGHVRSFTMKSDGVYHGSPGDTGVLTLDNGSLRLREVGGTVQVFRPDGRFDYIEDPNGNRITASYDDGGRLISLMHTNGEVLTFDYDLLTGRLVTVTDLSGHTATYEYEHGGQHLASVTTAQGIVEYAYLTDLNAARNHALASVTERDGTHVFYSYDDHGRVIGSEQDGGVDQAIVTYGPYGKVTFADAVNAQTTVLFNDFGKAEVIVDPLGRQTLLDYDQNHNIARAVSPNGAESFYNFCGCGSLTRSIDPMGHQLNLAYDPTFRQLTEFQDSRGIATLYDLDENGNLIASHYADGTQETFAYDEHGNVVDFVSRSQDNIEYSYDSSGLILSSAIPGIGETSYTYDAQGNMLTASNGSGTIRMQYDDSERLTRITYPNGRFIEYTYNFGNQRSTVNQNGFVIRYFYDVAGRLTDLTDSADTLIAHYQYDPRGYIALKQLGNGTFTTFTYDLMGQLSQLVNHAPDGTVNSRFEYTYDTVGRRVSESAPEGTTNFGYDLNGQLTSVSLPDGRIIRYEYDAAGNRVRVIDRDAETVYSVNNLNQYTSVGTTQLTYDSNGNIRTRTDSSGTTTYTFDALNQLISVVSPLETFTYEYDALGNRVAAIRNGQRREFLIDPTGIGNLVGEFDALGNPVANYAYGLGLVGQFDDADSYYFDFDALGSTTGLTDSAGGYVNEYRYLPFGETTVVNETVNNPFRYVGQFGVLDRGDGLLDMRMRNYEPEFGQFVSDDPLNLSGGDSNLRRYVSNSPVQFIDPTGLSGTLAVPGLNEGTPMPGKVCKVEKYYRIFIYHENGTIRKTIEGTWNQIKAHGTIPELNALVNAQEASSWRAESFKSYFYSSSIRKFRNEMLLAYSKKYVLKVLVKSVNVCDPFVASVTREFAEGIWNEMVRLSTAKLDIPNVVSNDPNEIIGPYGYGDESYTSSDHAFTYTVHFENDPEQATAPAQEVFVTHQLDSGLDWTTFELGDVGFGSMVINVPAGRNAWDTRVTYQNQDGSELLVDFNGALDLATGIVTWTFRSIDPEQGGLPEGVFDGFLPVNDATGRGEGFIDFLVRPKTALATGTVIAAQASIVFDINDPIVTNTFINRIDDGAPSSTVSPLSAVTSTATFVVHWSGLDDANGAPGSGIAFFDVFVSENGGPYTLFQTATTNTSGEFTGQHGHTYQFFSIATDNLGFTEPYSEVAEATTVVAPAIPVLLSPDSVTPDQTPTVTWQPAAGAASYDVWISDLTRGISPSVRVTVTGTSLTPDLPLGIGQHRVWVRSLDSAGNPSAWSLPRTVRINSPVIVEALPKFQGVARPEISWQPLPGAETYEVWINNISTGQGPWLREMDIEETAWASDSDLPLGRYRFWVRGVDRTGTGAQWSTFLDFVILAPPVPTSPPGGTFDRTPEFAWSAVPGAVSYKLFVVNRNTGVTTIQEAGITSTSWTPLTDLTTGSYRWWVYGVDAQGLHTFASIVTTIYVGGRTDIISPVGDSNDTTPTFAWVPVRGAARYSLWVNRIDVLVGVIRETELTTTEFTPTTALPVGTYRAWVQAISDTGEFAPWSLVREFQILADLQNRFQSPDTNRLEGVFAKGVLESPLLTDPAWTSELGDWVAVVHTREQDSAVAHCALVHSEMPDAVPESTDDNRDSILLLDDTDLDHILAADPALNFLDRIL